jgi:DNA-binding NarL/FixJ family response regulator
LDRPIRVLLADDHAVVRRGLRLFLDLQDGIEVVGEAADGAEAAEVAGAEQPDLVVMDLSMPGVDGIEATRLVRTAHGAAKVLVLSSFVDERVLPALRAGAEGYLTKDSEPAEVAAAIRSVHAGEPVFCPDALRRLTRELVGGRLRPEGTVTIAFTDVEGSTELLEDLGEQQARELLREHDGLVRSALDEHGGIEVEREGDAFMLAFSGARPALQCATAIQRALDEQPLRVRIGLNTGDVIAEEAGYFGRTVFLASRVAGQARGGEILVSQITRALAGDQPELRFVDRGEHELKGFAGRHHLWEVDWR